MGTRRTISAARGRPAWVGEWRERIMSRRRFLLSAAGGSLATLFPLRITATPESAGSPDDSGRWALIAAVQDHLFPSEPSVPGAREINATAYLKWVVGDENLDAEHRAFVLRGADWAAEQALALEKAPFTELGGKARERVLRAVAVSGAGENWLSTLLMYLFEALLTDPVYGGNPGAVGWTWLGHTPGFPRPPAHKRYWLL